jgi:hypothetical protein
MRESLSPSCSPEEAQGLTGEVAQLGVLPLALELADDDDGQDHVVLGEPEERLGVGEEHRRVEHVRALGHRRRGHPPRRARRAGLFGLRVVKRGHDHSISERLSARYLRLRRPRSSCEANFRGRLDRAPCPVRRTYDAPPTSATRVAPCRVTIA